MNTDVLTVTLNPSIDRTVYLTELIPHELNRAARTQVDPGGKGINVARVLQNFGTPVLATGLIGGDRVACCCASLMRLVSRPTFCRSAANTNAHQPQIV